MDHLEILRACGFSETELERGKLAVTTPIDGSQIGNLKVHSKTEVTASIAKSCVAFRKWREVPAPRRGELVRILAQELCAEKEKLGALVTLESGKILQEGLGEVQEMIDVCDFAVGLSRQLYGLTIASERLGHSMRETWHPLGVCGVITSFNFPVAPWCWNAALALVCGDPVLWKPSEKTPLSALAVQKICDRTLKRFGCDAPDGLIQTIIGDHQIGEELANSLDVPVISATGSVPMGRAVSSVVAKRLGRSILELGGNNGMIVTPSADLNLAVRAIVFSAVGTAGQRCTTLRRVIIQESIYDDLVSRLKQVFANLKIGNPLAIDTLVGPLIDNGALSSMLSALEKAKSDGGIVHGGHRTLIEAFPDAAYVHPAIVEMPEQSAIVCQETFAPILYCMRYDGFNEAIDLHNGVPQGLSSCIFSNDVRETEAFLSTTGSDCGIANVNIGPSGAEIGGAFGGEKETGGGRESGSDAWKGYMRRQTATVNYTNDLPFAQGIKFRI